MRTLGLIFLVLASIIVAGELAWGGVELSPAAGEKKEELLFAGALLAGVWLWVFL